MEGEGGDLNLSDIAGSFITPAPLWLMAQGSAQMAAYFLGCSTCYCQTQASPEEGLVKGVVIWLVGRGKGMEEGSGVPSLSIDGGCACMTEGQTTTPGPMNSVLVDPRARVSLPLLLLPCACALEGEI